MTSFLSDLFAWLITWFLRVTCVSLASHLRVTCVPLSFRGGMKRGHLGPWKGHLRLEKVTSGLAVCVSPTCHLRVTCTSLVGHFLARFLKWPLSTFYSTDLFQRQLSRKHKQGHRQSSGMYIYIYISYIIYHIIFIFISFHFIESRNHCKPPLTCQSNMSSWVETSKWTS